MKKDINRNINESMNIFYKELSFFKLAKKYPKELNIIITSFLRSKKFVIRTTSHDEDIIDINDLLTKEKKERDIGFNKIRSNISIGKAFFSASNSSDGSFKFPILLFNEITASEIIFKTNEEFFDTGHDFSFRLSTGEYPKQKSKQFSFKVDLTRKVDAVLREAFFIIEQKSKSFYTEESVAVSKARRSFVQDDSRRIFDSILAKGKVYTKGGKSSIKEGDDLPVVFSYVAAGNRSDKIMSPDTKPSKYTMSTRTQDFCIDIRIKCKNPEGQKFQDENPEIVVKHKKYIKTRSIINKVIGEYNRVESLKEALPSNIYGEEQHSMLNINFRTYCKRVARIGYFISKTYSSSYGRNNCNVFFAYKKDYVKFSTDKLEKIADKKFEELFMEVINKDYRHIDKVEDHFDNMIRNLMMSIIIKGDFEKFNKAIDELNSSGFSLSSNQMRSMFIKVLNE